MPRRATGGAYSVVAAPGRVDLRNIFVRPAFSGYARASVELGRKFMYIKFMAVLLTATATVAPVAYAFEPQSNPGIRTNSDKAQGDKSTPGSTLPGNAPTASDQVSGTTGSSPGTMSDDRTTRGTPSEPAQSRGTSGDTTPMANPADTTTAGMTDGSAPRTYPICKTRQDDNCRQRGGR